MSWVEGRDSNSQLHGPQPCALPIKLPTTSIFKSFSARYSQIYSRASQSQHLSIKAFSFRLPRLEENSIIGADTLPVELHPRNPCLYINPRIISTFASQFMPTQEGRMEKGHAPRWAVFYLIQKQGRILFIKDESVS